MTENDDGAWFAAKTFGYGAGLPIAWQGWVLLAIMVGVPIGLVIALIPTHIGYAPVAVLVPSLVFMPLVKAKTRGGWKWRNGRE